MDVASLLWSEGAIFPEICDDRLGSAEQSPLWLSRSPVALILTPLVSVSGSKRFSVAISTTGEAF